MSENTPGKCSSHQKKLLNIIKSLKNLYDSKLFLKKLNLFFDFHQKSKNILDYYCFPYKMDKKRHFSKLLLAKFITFY